MLGHCKRCSGPLAITQRFKMDAEGNLLDADGRRIPTDGEGRPKGKPVLCGEVVCSSCTMPDPAHPEQARLNADAARKVAAPPPATSVALPHTYSTLSAFDVMAQRQDRQQGLIDALLERVAALESTSRTRKGG